MKTVGLIAEYNPFHNGHKYHLQQAKELTNADYVIVVMSGDFTQRGYPAITDKFTRAHMALKEGADVVIELPVVYATASAQYFSLGAVSILQQLGCVDALVFGSECGDISALHTMAEFLSEEPVSYQKLLKEKLATGLSYPTARLQAISETFSEFSTDIPAILGEPNNILALEYLQAQKLLGSSITPYTLQRQGASYHQQSLSCEYGSASGIRNALLHRRASIDTLQHQMPCHAFEIFSEALSQHPPVSVDDFSSYLCYCLLSERTSLDTFLDIDAFLAKRMENALDKYETFSSFADLLKSKNYTHTRITRALCHILLHITTQDMTAYRETGISFYAKVLGFQKSAAPLLKAIKGNSSIPLITKLSSSASLLDSTGSAMLEKDLYASRIYHSVQKKGMAYNEYATPLIIL